MAQPAPAAGFQRAFSWRNDATLTLIRRRRVYQGRFASLATRNQRAIWTIIRNDITAAHPNFRPTRKQCRTKWNALKSGYENLERLLSGNPNGYRTRTPTMHDERFHEELSDEFWLAERNYLLFYLTNFLLNSIHLHYLSILARVRAARRNQVDRRTYAYRYGRRH